MPRKQLNQSWTIPIAVFVVAVALQNKFPLSSKFSINPGSMPKTLHTCFVDLGKVDGWVPRKKLWGMLWQYGVDGRLLLAAK